MRLNAGKILLILVVPIALYGAAKGLLYYKTKSAVDDVVEMLSSQADIRYADIATDLGGAVTVSNITVQPLGYEDSVVIDAVRISSDDPMFFLHGAQWEPGSSSPPASLGFDVLGVTLPLNADLLDEFVAGSSAESTTSG